MNFIFVFSTGRTGTAFLSQAFGQNFFNKNSENITCDGSCIVTQESWKNIPIKEMKLCQSLIGEDAFNISNEYLKNKKYKILKINEKCDKYFVTDHMVGRYLSLSLLNKHTKYKIIRICRRHDDVANSLIKKINNNINKAKILNQNEYINKLWSDNLYHPEDKFIINKKNINEWYNASLFEKFVWYSKEVDSQWEQNKKILNNNYIELQFDELVTKKGLNKISDYIEIPWSEYFGGFKVNE